MKRSPLLLRLGQESAQNMFRRVGFAVFKQSQRLQIAAFETALTALNTEVGNSATVLVSDLRKVNDQFSVVMLMLVDAIKAAASPAIGDVFTDVSEQEGSATDGNVAGCGNTGAVYGDVNVGGIIESKIESRA